MATAKKKTAKKKSASKSAKKAAGKSATSKPAAPAKTPTRAMSKKAASAKPAPVAKVPKKKAAKKVASPPTPSLTRTVNMGPERGDNSFPPGNKPMSQDFSRTDRTSSTRRESKSGDGAKSVGGRARVAKGDAGKKS